MTATAIPKMPSIHRGSSNVCGSTEVVRGSPSPSAHSNPLPSRRGSCGSLNSSCEALDSPSAHDGASPPRLDGTSAPRFNRRQLAYLYEVFEQLKQKAVADPATAGQLAANYQRKFTPQPPTKLPPVDRSPVHFPPNGLVASDPVPWTDRIKSWNSELGENYLEERFSSDVPSCFSVGLADPETIICGLEGLGRKSEKKFEKEERKRIKWEMDQARQQIERNRLAGAETDARLKVEQAESYARIDTNFMIQRCKDSQYVEGQKKTLSPEDWKSLSESHQQKIADEKAQIEGLKKEEEDSRSQLSKDMAESRLALFYANQEIQKSVVQAVTHRHHLGFSADFPVPRTRDQLARVIDDLSRQELAQKLSPYRVRPSTAK